ncbi:hypothetical protein Tsubulata_044550, partial [Turnera subulata]
WLILDNCILNLSLIFGFHLFFFQVNWPPLDWFCCFLMMHIEFVFVFFFFGYLVIWQLVIVPLALIYF